MAKKRFPEKLYVYREEDGTDYYFVAQETTTGLASADTETHIGVYHLAEQCVATAPTVITPVKKAKKRGR